MIKQIGQILLEQIIGLPFIDKSAGIVDIRRFKEQGPGNTFITKTFPVDCNLSFDECSKGKRYLDLCPDSKKTSVLYFEDNGLRLLRREGNLNFWRASLDLVCWLNLPRINKDVCSYSSVAIQAILKQLPVQPFNALNLYQYAQINVVGQRPNNYNPFNKYSYDETVMQFLMFPYDWFVLQIELDFRTDVRCFQIEDLNPADACLIK